MSNNSKNHNIGMSTGEFSRYKYRYKSTTFLIVTLNLLNRTSRGVKGKIKNDLLDSDP